MNNSIYYEDVNIGDELPTLIKHPTSKHLVMFAGASCDFYEVHYDKDFAKEAGLPGIIIQGMLSASYLAQVVTDWIGERGTLKKLSTRNQQVIFPNQDIVCRGVITEKYMDGDEHLVDCEVWAETKDAEKAVIVKAVVSLSDRSSN